MAGINRTTGKATDLITFSRASGGTALRKISYGSELVTNGTFDADTTGWTGISGGIVAYDNGAMKVTAVDGDNAGGAGQTLTTEVGKLYKVTFDVVSVDASWLANPTALTDNTTGSKEFLFTANSSSTTVIFYASGGGSVGDRTATFDNISVKEVLFDQPDGTLTLFNHPNNIPRIEYAADGTVKGLLIEEARTNLVTYSEDFTNASWNKVGSLVTLDQIGPDGAANSATTFVDNGAGGTGAITLQGPDITVSTSTAYTYSIFAKADQLGWLYVYTRGFTTPVDFSGAYFDLVNTAVGTASGVTASKIEDVGGGWRRCSISFVTDAADTVGRIDLRVAVSDANTTADLDGTSSILIYGAQVEAGSFPTSYIPTSGATATRAADIASISVDNFGYNQKAGSLVVVATPMALSSGNLFNLNVSGVDATSIYGNPSTVSHLVVRDTTTQVNLDAGAFVPGQESKLGVAIKEDDFAACLDGGSVVSDNSGTIPSPIATLSIGSTAPQTSFCNSHIKSIAYYPRRLSNAQLVELTS